MLLRPENNSVAYFAFQFSSETKQKNKQKACTMQADICLIFKKSCKSHTYSSLTSKGVEMTQSREGKGSVEAGDLVAYVMEVNALDSDTKCRGGFKLIISDKQHS
jgi:hypothetical protein